MFERLDCRASREREANGPAAEAKAGPGTEQLQGHTGLCVPRAYPLLSLQRSLSDPIKESQCPQSSAQNNDLVLPPFPF